jgi:hypothetical protein
MRTLVDSLIPYSQGFLFGLGLRVKGRTEKFVSTVSRIMSSHCAPRSYLSRFGVVEEEMCV